MKQSLFTILFIFVAFNLFAQKEVRDSIRAGNKAYKEQRYRVAESNYKSAIAKDPTSKEAAYNLANAYYKQNNWDEAIKTYQHYLNIETENPNNMSAAWHNIGNTMLKKKDLQNSLEAYKNALRLNPKDEQTRYNLAVVQKMIQDQQNQQDQNQDKNQDQNKDQKDQQQDQNKDQQQNKDNKDQQDKKTEKQENEQMSQENANQILQAIEQDEKETQEKVKQMKAAEKKQQNEDNRRQNKDW